MQRKLRLLKDNILFNIQEKIEDNKLIVYLLLLSLIIVTLIVLYCFTAQKMFLNGIGLIMSITALMIVLDK